MICSSCKRETTIRPGMTCFTPEKHGMIMCKHCNGYGSSFNDPEGVNTCTKCGGSGLVQATIWNSDGTKGPVLITAPPKEELEDRPLREVFTIMSSQIQKCPIRSLSPRHYLTDGSCRCKEVK